MQLTLSTVWDHLEITEGASDDYVHMKHFHYRGGRPGAIKRVLTARYGGPGLGGTDARNGMLAGIAVESLPSLGCSLRRAAIPDRFNTGSRSMDAAQLNAQMRTISRVVVHPIFRSVGLAVALVKRMLDTAETPYVEALAAMGRIHPFFEKAGMIGFDRPPLPGAIRLMAALESEGLQPTDLADAGRIAHSPFLEYELRRFAGPSGKSASWPDLLAHARGCLLSQPKYFIWKRQPSEPRPLGSDHCAVGANSDAS